MKGPHAWLLLCALHGVASMLLWWAHAPAVQALTWYAELWTTQPWTLWTSAWVHLNTPHLIGNQLALGALTAAGWVLRPPLAATLAWALSWPLLQASLLWWPQVTHAVGLSGLLHAGVVVLGLHLLLGGVSPLARPWGALLLAGLVVKLLLEKGWQQPLQHDLETELPVVQAVHLSGALWGAMLGALGIAWSRRQAAGSRRP